MHPNPKHPLLRRHVRYQTAMQLALELPPLVTRLKRKDAHEGVGTATLAPPLRVGTKACPRYAFNDPLRW